MTLSRFVCLRKSPAAMGISALVFLLVARVGQLKAADDCVYQDAATGSYRTAPTLSEVPEASRATARCRPPSAGQQGSVATEAAASSAPALSSQSTASEAADGYSVRDHAKVVDKLVPSAKRPSGMVLDGSERRTSVPTSLGRVTLRWSRQAEAYFDSTPERAIADAWDAASRAIAQKSLPKTLFRSDFGWSLILMSGAESRRADSSGLGGCHPAWMTPPADIYVVAEQVLTGCGAHPPLNQADAQLSLRRILIHELGHALEFHLQGRAFHLSERWHAEGFATWFETVAEPFARTGRRGYSRSELRERARSALRENWEVRLFRGSSDDYARAYALVGAIAEGRSTSALLEVYREMERQQLTFLQAVERRIGWDQKRLISEALKWLK